MAAMLERNGKDGKPIPGNLPAKEVIRCPHDECEFSYTLFYTDDEDRMVGSEKSLVKMQRMAVDLIKNEHPPHFTKAFLWKAIGAGPDCHWREADSPAARAAL
jgi:hypothetical protein